MPKSEIVLVVSYNTVVHNNVRTCTITIDGGTRISTNETLALNNFCIQYPNHIFFWYIAILLELLVEYVKK